MNGVLYTKYNTMSFHKKKMKGFKSKSVMFGQFIITLKFEIRKFIDWIMGTHLFGDVPIWASHTERYQKNSL
jgi:hypothetical protein